MLYYFVFATNLIFVRNFFIILLNSKGKEIYGMYSFYSFETVKIGLFLIAMPISFFYRKIGG